MLAPSCKIEVCPKRSRLRLALILLTNWGRQAAQNEPRRGLVAGDDRQNTFPSDAQIQKVTGTGCRIVARAPTRIDLAGGTLDIWPLYLFHPGAVTVNCAITRYAPLRCGPATPGSHTHFTGFARYASPGKFRFAGGAGARAAVRIAAAGAPGAIFSGALGGAYWPKGDHYLGSPRRGGHWRIERHGGGDLRGAQPLHNTSKWRRLGIAASPRGLDSHQPRYRGHGYSRPYGHAGSLPAGVWRRERHPSGTRGASAARNCACDVAELDAGWCFAIRGSRGSPASITGKCSCGTSMATGG